MALRDEIGRDGQKARLQDLDAKSTRLIQQANDFMTSAIALYDELGVEVDADSQAEVVATRDALQSAVTAALARTT